MLHTVRIANLLLVSAIALGLTPTSAHVGPSSAPPIAAGEDLQRWQMWNPPSPDAVFSASSDRIFRVAYLDPALLQVPGRTGSRSGPDGAPSVPPEPFLVERAEARVSELKLPEPGTGSVLMASAALTGFFFMRRLAR